MTWNISSLPNSASYKAPAPAANPPANSSASQANLPSQAQKPKTADDFSKLSFSGKAKNTGLATVQEGPGATQPNPRSAVADKPASAGGPESLSTDKKRQIMTNLQKDLETRSSSNNGSAAKQAMMNNVSQALKDVDLKKASDNEIEQKFSQVQEKMKAAQPNNAYQSSAALFAQMQSQVNLLG